MQCLKASTQAYMPGLPRSDLIQLSIFLVIFFLAACAMLGNWLGVSFLLNNVIILLVCFFTIALPPNTRIYYLFSIILVISGFVDILSIAFNWDITYDNYPGFLMFFSLFITLFLVVAKIVIAIHQFEIAKTLNSETSPVSIVGVYNSFINAITLQQNPVKVPEGTDMQAPGQVDIEAPATIYRKESVAPQEQSTTIEITPATEESTQRPIQASAENVKAFKPVKAAE